MKQVGTIFRQFTTVLLLATLGCSPALSAELHPRETVDYEGPLELTAAERDWLAAHPHIRLGVDPAWEPFEFYDSKGHYSGMAAEYMALLGDVLGVSLTPVPDLSWPQVMEATRLGNLDVLPAVLNTPQRRQFLSFTRAYLNFPMVIVTRDDASFIQGLDDLNGSRIGLVEGYATVEILKTGHPAVDLVEFKTLDEGLEAVSLGRVDAFVENLASIVSATKRTGLTNARLPRIHLINPAFRSACVRTGQNWSAF